MRFLADMGVSMRTIDWLRKEGHEALHLREEGMQRAPDEAIIVKAKKENRIVLTMDLDFGYLMAISGEALPSVILFRLLDERSESVNQKLEEVLSCCSDDLRSGAIVSVNETAIRIRTLPI